MIIGLSGKAGTGKDTVGNRIAQIYNFKRAALADPLKVICKEVFDFSHSQLWGPSEMRNAPDARYPREDGSCLTPREALQTLGTEFGRTCYKEIWIDLGIRRARSFLAPDPITEVASYSGVVFTDVRFRNEIEGLKRLGAHVVRITRPGAGLAGVAAQHPSEREQDEIPDSAFDYVLHNDGPLDVLDEGIVSMMNVLRGAL